MEGIKEISSGLEQKIYVFDVLLKAEDISATVEKTINIDEQLEQDGRIYAGNIYDPHWSELICTAKAPIDQVNLRDLKADVTSSYHVQALKSRVVHDITPFVIEGIVLTSDNKLVYGVRGGKVNAGKACIVPAGYTRYIANSTNFLVDGFYRELERELGIKQVIDSPIIIGYQTDPAFTRGLNVVFCAKTEESMEDIIDLHTRAYDVYKNAKERIGEYAAREKIGEAGYKNIEAWQHSALVGIDKNPKAIELIIQKGAVSYGNSEYPLLDIGRGPLIMLQHLMSENAL